jgi:hypothetical protein
VLAHVILHSRLEAKNATSQRDAGHELRRAGFHAGLIRANAQRLERLLARLRWRPGASEWSGYGDACSYTDAETAEKEAFVRAAAGDRRRRLVWDVGANDGRYSRIAADHADAVLAIDSDHAVVDRLYRDLRGASDERILPVVVDIADPSPALGWAGRERTTLEKRGRPDLVLCLAVVHHLALTNTVPLPAIVELLADFGTTVVVEFPHHDDVMAARLLARKRPGVFDDYRRDRWEHALAERFAIVETETLPGGTRTLYRCEPRGTGVS